MLDQVIKGFAHRHKNLLAHLDESYNKIKNSIPENMTISDTKKVLLGAYFSLEYSIESTAFFNPSIIAHPDQSGVPKGSLRFILSFRAVGEGHISSIEFRSGIVDKKGEFKFNKVSGFVARAPIALNPVYNRNVFFLKLKEMNVDSNFAAKVKELLPEEFDLFDLNAVLRIVSGQFNNSNGEDMIWLAKSNYELEFKLDQKLSERVIFPSSSNDSNGIEDARFVGFTDENGRVTYYATFTAYNGIQILPQLLETKNFLNFKIITLNGKFAKNKGMALFPRKINGKYMMISRYDGENLYTMESDNIFFWENAKLLKEPENPWEFFQIGNCGSPIETDRGWLVLTHGVGPMRKYCIGAILLDLNNPNKVLGSTTEPILSPTEEEREGYVPNVVYSCGALIHEGMLVIPYAMSDTSSGIATVSIDEILNSMVQK
jgi:predicted GH43/DUF377 family glycosyl hydrolase